jgi:hypothetical protein
LDPRRVDSPSKEAHDVESIESCWFPPPRASLSRLYWIIQNGIKDTGMIALGPTHQEQDLWAVSAFVRQLPQMTGERYHELVTQYQAQRSGMAAAPTHQH